MTQARKQLKITSIVILILALATLMELVAGMMTINLSDFEATDGFSEEILRITKIVVMVISVILLLPQIYIGLKGLKVAKRPDSSRAHIIVAIILLVFAVIAILDPLRAILGGQSVVDNLLSLLRCAVEITILYDYIKSARIIAG